jgi:hypothetical protein
MIWIIRRRPKRDPKFHQMEIFIGAGRSTIAVFKILRRGAFLRAGANI